MGSQIKKIIGVFGNLFEPKISMQVKVLAQIEFVAMQLILTLGSFDYT